MYYGERFNAISHLLGALLAVWGTLVLVALAALTADVWKVVSFAIYGATLVLAYSISTIYHSLRGPAKNLFRKLDHQIIYLLIAGTYTPFCLVTLRGPWGWSLFSIVWGLAAVGMLQEVRRNDKTRDPSVVLYVVMGWIALVAVPPLLEALGPAGFAWVAAGGVIYTVGIVFYAFDEKFKYWHGIWHLFVVAGSATHYFAILLYVL
jgi:hemolysin III